MFEDAVDLVLPQYTLKYLEALCSKLSIRASIVSHIQTFSAAATQAVLPKDCLVQKTVTDRVAGRLVAWTGVSDFRVPRRLYRAVNQTLGLPVRSEHTLNPKDIDAMQFYGMQPGMVSPFLIPDTPAIKQLSAICLLDWSDYDAAQSVAISLSLYKSLILPLASLDKIVRLYAAATYSHVPLYTL